MGTLNVWLGAWKARPGAQRPGWGIGSIDVNVEYGRSGSFSVEAGMPFLIWM